MATNTLIAFLVVALPFVLIGIALGIRTLYDQIADRRRCPACRGRTALLAEDEVLLCWRHYQRLREIQRRDSHRRLP